MKISVWSHGDPSVGINGQTAEIEIIGGKWVNEEGYREEVREALGDAFATIFDDRVVVAFEDELAEQVCEYTENED